MKRLTKSQYEHIASAIRWNYRGGSNYDQKMVLRALVKDLGAIFIAEDDQYKHNEFKKLCGIED